MEPKITSTKLLSTLSNQWLNFSEIVTIMGIDDPYNRRYLKTKLKELTRKGKIEYVYRSNNKYWKANDTIRSRSVSFELLNNCPRCFKIIKEEDNFCMWCGTELKKSSRSDEMEEQLAKHSESLFSPSKEKLSFCSECGALMLPTIVNNLRIMKCKCGATKSFDEDQLNMYVLKTNIVQPFDEESMYFCVCGKKFASQIRFITHSKACEERRKNINIQK